MSGIPVAAFNHSLVESIRISLQGGASGLGRACGIVLNRDAKADDAPEALRYLHGIAKNNEEIEREALDIMEALFSTAKPRVGTCEAPALLLAQKGLAREAFASVDMRGAPVELCGALLENAFVKGRFWWEAVWKCLSARGVRGLSGDLVTRGIEASAAAAERGEGRPEDAQAALESFVILAKSAKGAAVDACTAGLTEKLVTAGIGGEVVEGAFGIGAWSQGRLGRRLQPSRGLAEMVIRTVPMNMLVSSKGELQPLGRVLSTDIAPGSEESIWVRASRGEYLQDFHVVDVVLNEGSRKMFAKSRAWIRGAAQKLLAEPEHGNERANQALEILAKEYPSEVVRIGGLVGVARLARRGVNVPYTAVPYDSMWLVLVGLSLFSVFSDIWFCASLFLQGAEYSAREVVGNPTLDVVIGEVAHHLALTSLAALTLTFVINTGVTIWFMRAVRYEAAELGAAEFADRVLWGRPWLTILLLTGTIASPEAGTLFFGSVTPMKSLGTLKFLTWPAIVIEDLVHLFLQLVAFASFGSSSAALLVSTGTTFLQLGFRAARALVLGWHASATSKSGDALLGGDDDSDLATWHREAIPGASSNNESLGSQSIKHILSSIIAAACLTATPLVVSFVVGLSSTILVPSCALPTSVLPMSAVICILAAILARIPLVAILLSMRQKSGAIAVDIRRNAEILGLISFLAIIGDPVHIIYFMPNGRRHTSSRLTYILSSFASLALVTAGCLLIATGTLNAERCCANVRPVANSYARYHCIPEVDDLAIASSTPVFASMPSLYAGCALTLSTLIGYWQFRKRHLLV